MPIKRAAYKAVRADKKKRARNVSVLSSLKTLSKTVTAALTANNKEALKKAADEYISALDKAAQKGVIHRNNASRKISRLQSKVSSLSAKK